MGRYCKCSSGLSSPPMVSGTMTRSIKRHEPTEAFAPGVTDLLVRQQPRHRLRYSGRSFLQWLATDSRETAASNDHISSARQMFKFNPRLAVTCNPVRRAVLTGTLDAQLDDHLRLMEKKRCAALRQTNTYEQDSGLLLLLAG
jgi:hypothetical protein